MLSRQVATRDKMILICSIILSVVLCFGGSLSAKDELNQKVLSSYELRPFYEEAFPINFPSLDMINYGGSCGLASHTIVDETTVSRSGGAYASLNPVTSWNAGDLTGKSVGIYHYLEPYILLNGDVSEQLRSVALGYKCNWLFDSYTTSVGGTNGVYNTATTPTGIVTAKSKNVVESSVDTWVAFELMEPVVGNGVSYQNDKYSISFEGANEDGVYVEMTPSYDPSTPGGTLLGKVTYTVSVSTRTNGGTSVSNLGNVTANVGDWVLFERSSSNAYSVSVGGQPIAFLTGGNTYTYTIGGVVSLNYRASVHDDYQLGPLNVLTSFSCPLINFFQLYDKVSSNFAVINNGILGFEFVEPYYYTGDISFKVYDAYHHELASITTANLLNAEVTFGENYLELDVSSLATGDYLLETTDSKGNKKYLRFKKV